MDLQKLIFSGKILENDKTLEAYGIKEKDFLVVMVSKPKAAKPVPKAEEPKKEERNQEEPKKEAQEATQPAAAPAAPAASETPSQPSAPASSTPSQGGLQAASFCMSHTHSRSIR